MITALSKLPARPVLSLPAQRGGVKRPARHFPDVSLISVVTLVIWMACMSVALLGHAMPYERPRPPKEGPPPIEAELIQVELTSEPFEDLAPSPPPLVLPPPLDESLLAPAEAPPMATVLEPLPTVPFPMPVDEPPHLTAPTLPTVALHTNASVATEARPTAPPVQAITYGRGEGKQPAPDYPRQSVRAGQEGTVVVRFSVAENGRVLAAQSPVPSPWPLLNEAALRVVRERWRFRPGLPRMYEVAIRFELSK
jgi:protein TonB